MKTQIICSILLELLLEMHTKKGFPPKIDAKNRIRIFVYGPPVESQLKKSDPVSVLFIFSSDRARGT